MPNIMIYSNCTMHILPKELQEDVEFIFKIKENISGNDLKKLNFAVKKELYEYGVVYQSDILFSNYVKINASTKKKKKTKKALFLLTYPSFF